jgi:hypothetical protein
MIVLIFAFGIAMIIIMSKTTGANDDANITKFNPVDPNRIKLNFEQLKCGNQKAVKVFNTDQFGLINVDVYKGDSYSDNGFNFIEIRKDNKTLCILDEMNDNDLILSMMLLKRL